MITITGTAPEVPLPTGASHVSPWEYDHPMPSRPFFGVPRGVSGRTIVVGTAGHQWADGSIESIARIEIIGYLHGLSGGQARELASALLQAADEVDGWLAHEDPSHNPTAQQNCEERGGSKAASRGPGEPTPP